MLLMGLFDIILKCFSQVISVCIYIMLLKLLLCKPSIVSRTLNYHFTFYISPSIIVLKQNTTIKYSAKRYHDKPKLLQTTTRTISRRKTSIKHYKLEIIIQRNYNSSFKKKYSLEIYPIKLWTNLHTKL